MNAIEKDKLASRLETALMHFHQHEIPLKGIVPVENRLSFIYQLIDSIQRIQYIERIRGRDLSPLRARGDCELFDPLKAAIIKHRGGDIEEACWLTFLATHFGKNLRTGWRLSGEVYSSLGNGTVWDWNQIQHNVAGFQAWLANHHGDCTGRFGNHRKYESLKPGGNGTGAVVESYVKWIRQAGSHQALFQKALADAHANPKVAFSQLYRDMRCVHRFGRTGRFDYLTMLAKLGLAQIEADSAYLSEATGPKSGARLLFDGQIKSKTGPSKLEASVARLDDTLKVGKQVLEDAMCNWQKSPNRFVAFRG